MRSKNMIGVALVSAMLTAAGSTGQARAGDDYPPFGKVSEGLEQVVSMADGSSPLYELHQDRETGRLLAVLPASYEKQLLMIAATISGGDPEAGVMGPTYYAKWEKIGKQLALVAPNLFVRTDGDQQAKDSVAQLYTGRVLVSVPIVSMHKGRPVIDMGALLTRQAGKFFGPSVFGQYGPSGGGIDARLAKLTKAKAFPENVIVEYRAPRANGQLVSLTYDVSVLEGTPGFKPRQADNRVGYFYNYHQDFARSASRDVTERYITRWHVEKADPSLKLSPPKQPIVWYIEHTTPVRFRRYVRDGILFWNKAFEEIGIAGALEVRQQDAATGAYMNIDPEDARYNFFRWNASDQGYAIGPSRTNPFTGEILDADVVWHQGLTRGIRAMLESMSDDFVEQTFDPATIAWLDANPEWDPRVRLRHPAKREQFQLRRELRLREAAEIELATPEHPWSQWAADQTNTSCRIGAMIGLDMNLAAAALSVGLLEGEGVDLLEGLPEEYVGAMIRYISAHEVGHCLGLQHNMAASTIRELDDINSADFDGPSVGSVMDYVAANINHELGDAQGPYATPEVGPYDKWAIAFGYGDAKDREEILGQVSEPDHIYVSQIAMSVGADPRNMTWDMGADNLAFARSRLSLVQELRTKLITDITDEGESWSNVRRRFQSLLGSHVQSLLIASNWVGGSFINNDNKGDPGDRTPIADVPAERQREALQLVIDNAFQDAAFGLTPELIRHMGKEYWWDPQGLNNLLQDPSFEVHDMVGAIQATALTLVMNPGTLRRVYDNEFRTQGQEDQFTLAEVVGAVTHAIWIEYAAPERGAYDPSNPMVSSFRRNLQREHVGRLTTLALLQGNTSPALRTISSLAAEELRRIDTMAERAQQVNPDAYTAAHLADVRARIDRALDAVYVVVGG